jgi:hypothetical protein
VKNFEKKITGPQSVKEHLECATERKMNRKKSKVK